jgi:hypothetical protein
MIAMDELEHLVVAAAAGQPAAWAAFAAALEPWLARLVADPRFVGRVGQGELDRHHIVQEVMNRLSDDGFARLRLYLEARRENPRLALRTWLRVVAKRAGVDYARGATGPRLQTERVTAAQLMRRAAGVVPEPQLSALEMWVQSVDYPDIARALELADAAAAEQLVAAALTSLRPETP